MYANRNMVRSSSEEKNFMGAEMKIPEPRYLDRKGISNSRGSKCEKAEVHKSIKYLRNYMSLHMADEQGVWIKK